MRTDKSNEQLTKDGSKTLVNPDDPLEMQRIQETKPARTTTGPGETSVSSGSAKKSEDAGAPADDSKV